VASWHDACARNAHKGDPKHRWVLSRARPKKNQALELLPLDITSAQIFYAFGMLIGSKLPTKETQAQVGAITGARLLRATRPSGGPSTAARARAAASRRPARRICQWAVERSE